VFFGTCLKILLSQFDTPKTALPLVDFVLAAAKRTLVDFFVALYSP
jgi:hypothetical protein